MSSLMGRVSSGAEPSLLRALNNHQVTFTGPYPPPANVNVLYTFVDVNSAESQKFMREIRATSKMSIFFHAPLLYGFELTKLATLYGSDPRDSNAIYRYMNGTIAESDLNNLPADAYAHINNSSIFYQQGIKNTISDELPISFLNMGDHWMYMIGCGEGVKREILRFS